MPTIVSVEFGGTGANNAADARAALSVPSSTTTNAAYNQANSARDQANTARDTANGAYAQANGAYAQANGAYAHANIVYGQANAAYGQANSAYGAANTAGTNALNAYAQANNAYTAANNAQTTAQNAYGQANAAYGQANSAYGQANAAYGQANSAYGQANNAYAAANTKLPSAGGTISGDLVISGNLVVSGNSTTLNTEILIVTGTGVNVAGTLNATGNVSFMGSMGANNNTFPVLRANSAQVDRVLNFGNSWPDLGVNHLANAEGILFRQNSVIGSRSLSGVYNYVLNDYYAGQFTCQAFTADDYLETVVNQGSSYYVKIGRLVTAFYNLNFGDLTQGNLDQNTTLEVDLPIPCTFDGLTQGFSGTVAYTDPGISNPWGAGITPPVYVSVYFQNSIIFRAYDSINAYWYTLTPAMWNQMQLQFTISYYTVA